MVKKSVSLFLSVILLLNVFFIATISVNAGTEKDYVYSLLSDGTTVSPTEPSTAGTDNKSERELEWGNYSYGDYEYNILEDGTAVIEYYFGSDSEVVIPSKLNNYTVTGIYPWAFYYCENYDNITSITIPDSVTFMNGGAFSQMPKLKRVVIGKSVTEIGKEAFFECSSLEGITIPDSVKNVEPRAFYDCKNLSNVIIGKGVTKIGASAFFRCMSLKSVTIPETVTEIGEHAFGFYNSDEDPSWRKIPEFTIYGKYNSEAERYAEENGFKFIHISSEENKPSSDTSKKSNPVKITAKTMSVKAKALKAKKQTVKPLTIKNAKGAVAVVKVKKGTTAKIYKLITVNRKTGAITFKKGNYAKKTYSVKLKIIVAGNSDYSAKTVSKVVKIKIK